MLFQLIIKCFVILKEYNFINMQIDLWILLLLFLLSDSDDDGKKIGQTLLHNSRLQRLFFNAFGHFRWKTKTQKSKLCSWLTNTLLTWQRHVAGWASNDKETRSKDDVKNTSQMSSLQLLWMAIFNMSITAHMCVCVVTFQFQFSLSGLITLLFHRNHLWCTLLGNAQYVNVSTHYVCLCC